MPRKRTYEDIYWDTLGEDERRMIDAMRMDEEEEMLKDQIRLSAVRERRLLQGIRDMRASGDALVVQSVEEVIEQKEDSQLRERTTEKRLAARELAGRYEAELTRVQAQKTRCIQALSKLRLERKKLAFMMGTIAREEEGRTDPFVEALMNSPGVWEEEEV